MTPQQRAEKIVQWITDEGWDHFEPDTWAKSIAAQISKAEREALGLAGEEISRLQSALNDQVKAIQTRCLEEEYQKGFRAAIEKAANLADDIESSLYGEHEITNYILRLSGEKRNDCHNSFGLNCRVSLFGN